MAVTVVLSRNNGVYGRITSKDVFDAGESFSTDDLGHLSIHRNGGGGFVETIGAYKPGAWIAAFVDESLAH